jgi:exosortase J
VDLESCFLTSNRLRFEVRLAIPMAEKLELVSAATPETQASASLSAPRPRLLLGCSIAILAAVGCLGIYRELALLWITWTSDPLRSIGMLIPPVSILLTLRVWRQCGWQMRGTWWGVVVIGLSYFLSLIHQKVLLIAVFGDASLSVIPTSLPVYVYCSGIVLLFAGTSVWRKAWFPIGLLLLSQPVPLLANSLIDIPLQNISARVARSFATLIHFAPTTPQLRLMFSPNFGMFIAPGCDGIRGAVTMGYVALILGYVKRVSWFMWAGYVAGAVLLGYLFNFIRLCVLVLYYRIALGHPRFESVAKQADYVIGSCLFLVATFLFLWVASRKQRSLASDEPVVDTGGPLFRIGSVWIKCAAFAVTVLVAVSLPSSALNTARSNPPSPESLAARMPKQIGDFELTRTWYEQMNGTPVVQAGAYSAPGSDEIILGVWVAKNFQYHDSTWCWLARGLHPDILTTRQFLTAGGEPLALKTGFYTDGVTDSIVVNANCTPGSCSQFQNVSSGKQLGFVFLESQLSALATPAQHPVTIMVRIDKLHSLAAKTENYDQLSTEAQKFISGLDPINLSRSFQ